MDVGSRFGNPGLFGGFPRFTGWDFDGFRDLGFGVVKP